MLYLKENKHYIITALIFFFVSIYYLILTPTELSWRNVSYDSPNYLMSAKYLVLSHPSPGAPLYNIFNAVWIRLLPLGSDYLKIALISVFSSAGVAALLYYFTKNMLSPLIWLASSVVLSQSVVLEVYATISLMTLVAYWLHRTEHRNWAYLIIGLGLAIHHLIGFLFVFLIASDYIKRKEISLKPILFVFISLPFFLYIPLVNREPYIWITGESLHSYYLYFFSQGGLTGGLAIIPANDLIERIKEFTILSFSSFGFFLIYSKKVIETQDKLLLGLIGVILLYYFTNLAPQTFTYLVPAIALISLAIGLAIKGRMLIYFPLMILLISLNFASFAQQFTQNNVAQDFYQSLNEIPSNSIVWSQNRGWEKTTIQLYNNDRNTRIDQVNLHKPFREPKELKKVILDAEKEGRLYKSVVLDPQSLQVELVHASAQDLFGDSKLQPFLQP